MELLLTPARLRGTVTPPPSKSQVHRLLLAAALGEGEAHVGPVALSQDIEATVRCLEALGACGCGASSPAAGRPLRSCPGWTAGSRAPRCAF